MAMAHERTPAFAPDFLYIGAPRAGSTWLYLNLQKHPDVWIPPCKGINYFHPRFQIYRLHRLQHFWKDAFIDGKPEVRAWYRKYFLTPFVNDRWYINLFPKERVTGEIAESYCSLSRDRIQHIHRVMPRAKIIFVLRNPVERVLSQGKWGLAVRKARSVENVPLEDFIRYIDRPESRACSYYSRSLDLWHSVYPKDQFLTMFYDELTENPEKFLQRICHFLDVPFKAEYFRDTVSVRSQKTDGGPLPPAVLRHAARSYRDEVKELAARLGGHALRWQDEVERILAG